VNTAADIMGDIPKRIVLATRNRGKMREVKEILGDLGIELLTLDELGPVPEVEEGGETFLENAVKKAKEVSSHTGLPALADDSGLEVDRLNGAPGVRSARFAGPGASDSDRYGKLLSLLEGVPDEKRTARFRCAVALAFPDGRVITAEGSCKGRIADRPRGSGGFGYDPVFISDDPGMIFAEASPELKNSVSHRRRALMKLREILEGDGR